MKMICTTVYQLDELSDKAKEKARDWFREGYEYPGEEALASLEALAEHFGAKVSDYSIDWSGACSPSSASFSVGESLDEDELAYGLVGLGAFNPGTLRGLGDCVFTGVCTDEDVIDGFRIAYHAGERDLDTLLQAGFNTLIAACQSEYEYQTGDEGADENILANEYTFTEAGARF